MQHLDEAEYEPDPDAERDTRIFDHMVTDAEEQLRQNRGTIMATDISDMRLDALRRHAARLIAEDKSTTEKLIGVLTDDETKFISNFNGEEFLELPALRRMGKHLTKILEIFDAGNFKTGKYATPITDPAEFIRAVGAEQGKRVLGNVRTSFSSSVAANQMENYERKLAADVYEICVGW